MMGRTYTIVMDAEDAVYLESLLIEMGLYGNEKAIRLRKIVQAAIVAGKDSGEEPI